jgi:hypothetical protein
VPDGERKQRRWLPAAIVVIASLIAFLSVFAIWIKRQALETETWTDTSSELLENEEIRDALADFLTTQLFDNVDVEGEIAAQLPPPADRLAGPAAAGVRQLADEAAREALARPEVQSLWEDANRAAHERLLAVIDGDAEAVSTSDGAVVLDLAVILEQITEEIGVGSGLADKIPPDAAQLEVMDEEDLDAIRGIVDLLRTLAWLLLAIAIALYALAIYLARGRRRETLRMIGYGFIVVGALVLLGQRLAGDAVVSALTGTAAAEPAAEATWEIATSLLTDSGSAVVAYGVFIVLAAWFAGPTRLATSARRGLTPYLRQPRFAFGGLAVFLVLLFLWNPLPSTDRLPTSLLLIVLLAVGVEFLRRHVIREFPGEVTTWSSEGMASGIADRMREARERRVSRRPDAAAAPSRVDELERLGALRDSGVLSDEEFAAEKQRLLGGS